VNLGIHKSHDLFKSQNTLSVEVNKDVCESFGCFKEAIEDQLYVQSKSVFDHFEEHTIF
jgi:hypothetical protein